jgi:Skp family chaperone for outer membrane proteins
MKPYRFAAIAAAFLFCFSLHAQAQTALKVAIVDLNAAFKDYGKTKEADERLKERMNSFKTERDKMMEDYKKATEQAQSLQNALKDSSLSADAKKEREEKFAEKFRELQSREREIKEYEGTSAKILQEQSQRMRKSIVDEISDSVKQVAKGKYNMVLDTAGMTLNGTSAVVYTEGMTDITAEVIKHLNSKPATPAEPAK